MPALESQRYERFAQEYARTGSTRTAALALDIGTGAAYGLLKRPEIQSRINELTTQRFTRAEITANRVMTELARIAFFDPRTLYDANGDLLPLHMLDDDTAAVVSGCKLETRMVGRGDEAVPWLTKDVKFASKMDALGVLAKHFKLVNDTSDGVDALAEALVVRLNNARRRAQARRIDDISDAEIVGGRTEYGMDGDPSDANILTPPRLELPDADPESINNHSVSAADAVYSREIPTPAATEADDEDLSQ